MNLSKEEKIQLRKQWFLGWCAATSMSGLPKEWSEMSTQEKHAFERGYENGEVARDHAYKSSLKYLRAYSPPLPPLPHTKNGWDLS